MSPTGRQLSAPASRCSAPASPGDRWASLQAPSGEGIVVATTARWLWVKERDFTADICIVDEAWQMSYADLGGLGPLSAQIVLVGDPGQIAPVVTGERRWRDWSAGSQHPAPEATLVAYPESVNSLKLQQTWRLGPKTTATIQPAAALVGVAIFGPGMPSVLTALFPGFRPNQDSTELMRFGLIDEVWVSCKRGEPFPGEPSFGCWPARARQPWSPSQIPSSAALLT